MNYNKSLFSGVPKKHSNKSRFNLSHEYKCQLQPGYLVPVLTMETMPGDEFDLDTEFMFRFSPLYFPIMHKLTMRADYFYIPNRILWPDQGPTNSGWSKWIAENNEQTHPHFTPDMERDAATWNNHICAYMGIPLIDKPTWGGDPGLIDTRIEELNAFPLSAILKLWDEWYRIPQLEDEIWFPLAAGDNTSLFDTAFSIFSGGAGFYPCIPSKWEKDYFTSALPTPQVGDAIQVPMVGEDGVLPHTLVTDVGGVPVDGGLQTVGGDMRTTGGGGGDVFLDIQETAATIKQLRLAETLQHYYERIMKIGQRYRDFIEGMFATDPTPMAVDVPVMIGSKFGRVQIADVMTQAATDITASDDFRTGDYSGQANLYERSSGKISYTCREHGFLICIMQVNPNSSYGQGIARFWRRNIQTEYPLDLFSGIGDQEIAKEELLYNPVIAEEEKNFETFGYIPRHSEMRYQNNIFVGELVFNGGYSQHAGRIWNGVLNKGVNYDANIEINAIFTEVENEHADFGGVRITDLFRVLPTFDGIKRASEGTIFAHLFHSIYVNRNLPVFAVPKM